MPAARVARPVAALSPTGGRGRVTALGGRPLATLGRCVAPLRRWVAAFGRRVAPLRRWVAAFGRRRVAAVARCGRRIPALRAARLPPRAAPRPLAARRRVGIVAAAAPGYGLRSAAIAALETIATAGSAAAVHAVTAARGLGTRDPARTLDDLAAPR